MIRIPRRSGVSPPERPRRARRWRTASALLSAGVLVTSLLGLPAALAVDDSSSASAPAASGGAETAAEPTAQDTGRQTDGTEPAAGTPVEAEAETGTEDGSGSRSQDDAGTLTAPALLRDGTGLYPRVLRLEHSGEASGRVLASVVTFEDGNGLGAIYESTDDGATFEQVGTVADPESSGGKGLCCATLYELPQPVGDLPAGTLLWASSAGQDEDDRRMSLRIWTSHDVGRTWSYLSSCATAPNDGGLWEPEFTIAEDGALVCYYADETDSAHSQKLSAVRSYDGVTWSDPRDVVASDWPEDRPGMPVVRKLPNGTYFMSYEICNPGGQYQCVVHYRTSPDGWDWGDPAHLGYRPETADGRYFRATPTIAWAPDPGGDPDGRILLIGQMLLNADGSTAEGNGSTVMVNSSNGEGPWTAIPAPVPVPDAQPDYCPNYSSPLLPSADGTRLLEIATDWDGDVCKPYYATAPLG